MWKKVGNGEKPKDRISEGKVIKRRERKKGKR
jgi:hypothetical protein